MIGERQLINGDPWVVVDVSPAPALGEMVAALLEDEGFVCIVRGAEDAQGILTHLGAHSIGTTLVLVPEQDAERAMALIAETVTDYQGDEIDAVLASMDFDAEEDEGADTRVGMAGDGDDDRPDAG